LRGWEFGYMAVNCEVRSKHVVDILVVKVVERSRLRWRGHVLRKDVIN